MLTYTLLESIATDLHGQHSNKEYEQKFNHEWEMLANDKGQEEQLQSAYGDNGYKHDSI